MHVTGQQELERLEGGLNRGDINLAKFIALCRSQFVLVFGGTTKTSLLGGGSMNGGSMMGSNNHNHNNSVRGSNNPNNSYMNDSLNKSGIGMGAAGGGAGGQGKGAGGYNSHAMRRGSFAYAGASNDRF